jgi:hypothetical protein
MRMGASAPPPARRVRRLHVRGAADDEVTRATTLLSDALHTASLPFADQGRLVLIRRLNLGPISTHAGASTIALQIEEAARAVMSQAVSWDARRAPEANAVYFASRGEALVALAVRHSRGEPTDEWFWSAVIPRWRTVSPGDRWRRLLDAAHDLPDATLVAAAIVERAVDAGADTAMLAAIEPEDADRWLTAEGWAMRDEPIATAARSLPLTTKSARIVARARQACGVDSRMVWLATLLAIVDRPSTAADHRLAERIRRGLVEWSPDVGALVDDPSIDSDAPFAASSNREQQTSSERFKRTSDLSPDAAAVQTTAMERGTGSTVEDAQLNASDALEGARTSHGGLLFIVPVLERLGFAEFVDRNPRLIDAEFPNRFLLFVGERVGMIPDDPLARALEVRARHGQVEAVAAGLPGAVTDLLDLPIPRCAVETPYDCWLVAVRRWCRRHARMGLATLICRPARVQASLTHIDVAFPLSTLEVRIRRHALDVDPGWVPWLGRVVQFAYSDVERLRSI